jgi:hypothetical protein
MREIEEPGGEDGAPMTMDKAITFAPVSNSLADLAARIRTYHDATITALRNSVINAMAAGDLLIEAKLQLRQHGAWLPWLASCGLSERTSQRYMRLARNRTIIEAKSDTVSDLGIRGALALLAVPRKLGTDEITDGLIDLTDYVAETAFDLWDGTGAERRGSLEKSARKALLAEAKAAIDILPELATTPELVKIIEDASGDFCERLTAACAEFRQAVCGEMGLSDAELGDLEADIARCKARGDHPVGLFLGKWGHTLGRDPCLPEGSATAVVSRVRDIATEWARHIGTIVADATRRSPAR